VFLSDSTYWFSPMTRYRAKAQDWRTEPFLRKLGSRLGPLAPQAGQATFASLFLLTRDRWPGTSS